MQCTASPLLLSVYSGVTQLPVRRRRVDMLTINEEMHCSVPFVWSVVVVSNCLSLYCCSLYVHQMVILADKINIEHYLCRRIIIIILKLNFTSKLNPLQCGHFTVITMIPFASPIYDKNIYLQVISDQQSEFNKIIVMLSFTTFRYNCLFHL